MNFFGDCGATDDIALLKHQRFQASLSKIASGYQAVMTTADNYDVVLSHSPVETKNSISRGFARSNADQKTLNNIRQLLALFLAQIRVLSAQIRG